VPVPHFPEVVEAARQGDGRAYETLYRAYAARVLGYARCHGATDAEDLVGEVFLAVVRGLGRFQGDELAFRAWLFTIAHHRLVAQHRHRARRVEDATDPANFGSDVRETAPDVFADLDPVASARLRGALATLTSEQRDVVLLRIVADLPVADVASALGKAEGAVKMLQRRALASLGRELSRDATRA
jgi:RNA polymerase sigma-70 factor, ECF subfamily